MDEAGGPGDVAAVGAADRRHALGVARHADRAAQAGGGDLAFELRQAGAHEGVGADGRGEHQGDEQPEEGEEDEARASAPDDHGLCHLSAPRLRMGEVYGLLPLPLAGEGWGEGPRQPSPHPDPLPQAGEGDDGQRDGAEAETATASFAGSGTTCPGVSVGASPGGMCGSWCAMPLWQSMQVFSLLAR